MKVDFHIHSTASDGTMRPAAIARMTADFAAVALTDHDNTDGIAEFLSAGVSGASCRRVAGVEISIEPGEGFDRFHLLALGVDPGNKALKDLLACVVRWRDERNMEMTENFRKIGIDIKPVSKGNILARPHFARYLVKHHYATSVAEAFAKYLLWDSPPETRCYAKRKNPSQENAFAAVHAAGGICVMGHPKFWKNEWKRSPCDFAAAERGLAALKEKGLDGVESIYAANSPREDVEFTRIADRLGFLKTAGSDYHGNNKPSVVLGMEVDDAFVAPVLERIFR